MRIFPKSKAVSCKVIRTRKRLFSVFFGASGILETQDLFPKAYFTHKPIENIFALVRGLLEYARTLGFAQIWYGYFFWDSHKFGTAF